MDWKKLHKSAADKLSRPEYDAIAEKWFELGKVTSQEGSASRLRVLSGEYYAGGREDAAKIIKAAAVEAEGCAKEARRKYDEKYHE